MKLQLLPRHCSTNHERHINKQIYLCKGSSRFVDSVALTTTCRLPVNVATCQCQNAQNTLRDWALLNADEKFWLWPVWFQVISNPLSDLLQALHFWCRLSSLPKDVRRWRSEYRNQNVDTHQHVFWLLWLLCEKSYPGKRCHFNILLCQGVFFLFLQAWHQVQEHGGNTLPSV